MAGPSYGSGAPDTVPEVDSPGQGFEPIPASTLPGYLSPWVALVEVLLVCGIPTQVLIFVPIALFTGVPILQGRQVSIELFAVTSLLDTALIAILIRLFLGLSGETSADVFLGRRPPFREAALGLAVLPGVFLVVAAIALGVRTLAPWLHTVSANPLEAYMRTPLDAAIFGVVVILAGGVREELQRAFILHRFEQRLGGAWVGLAVFSAFFGALHLTEGADAAVAIGVLGLFWGVVYIKRRSAILPLVNHAGFDVLQVLQVVLVRGFSG
jgi:membrane protease YdiL (CAAX protease family)